MIISLTIIAVLIIIGLAAIIIYNRLVKNKNLTDEAWSGIDVQLKRRTNLIPNLVEAVKGYMGHERGVLEDITSLRTASIAADDVDQQAKIENRLTGALKNLFAVAENYPDLKANGNFIDLQRQLAEIEDQIQMARRYYNGAARNMNILVESFPSNIVAQLFSFRKREYFEIEEPADRALPSLKGSFS
jgi:LemA protein